MLIGFLILTVSFAQAASLVCPDGGGQVVVFKTEDLMDYAIDHINAKKDLYDPTLLTTIAALVPSGTRCSILKTTWTRKQVRLLEGKFKGTVGWVPREMVRN